MSTEVAVFVADDDPIITKAVIRGGHGLVSVLLTSTVLDAELVVASIDSEEVFALVDSYRAAHPGGYLLGYTRSMDPATWLYAERHGFDRVEAYGRVALATRLVLKQLTTGVSRRLQPICAVGDVAGRLGALAHIDSPIGEIGLFRVTGGVYCVTTTCPHARASLADGIVEADVVTCPAHGSQFSVVTGERLRGPSDEGLRMIPVVEDGGRFWAVLPLGEE